MGAGRGQLEGFGGPAGRAGAAPFGHGIEIAGQAFILMAERCVYWPAQRTLIAADLHLGKCDTFRAAGLAMPSRVAAGVLEEQLARLARALTLTGAQRLLVVGDLLHAPAGLTPEMVDAVARWRSGNGVRLMLVSGNHDRRIERVSEPWRVEIETGSLREGPFVFVHDPAEAPAEDGLFSWCGHVHPTVRVVSGVDAVKLPCFVIDRRAAILPAFSRFTSGVAIRAANDRRLFAIAEDSVIPMR
ncbi:MAG: ligase-associated DNA damage response endonuclease PdeM [Phycisphaerales bacterium]|nr:ligase-associated DNA damage response endonuclease PdeM [Phycisphaerales bacterium]